MLPSIEKVREITKELQKIMSIQDYKLTVDIVSVKDMIERGFGTDANAYYIYTKKRNFMEILINKDSSEMNKDDDRWYISLVHELKHAQSMELWTTIGMHLEHIENARVEKKSQEDMEIFYESYVDRLAEEFVSVYPLSKFNL